MKEYRDKKLKKIMIKIDIKLNNSFIHDENH